MLRCIAMLSSMRGMLVAFVPGGYDDDDAVMSDDVMILYHYVCVAMLLSMPLSLSSAVCCATRNDSCGAKLQSFRACVRLLHDCWVCVVSPGYHAINKFFNPN